MDVTKTYCDKQAYQCYRKPGHAGRCGGSKEWCEQEDWNDDQDKRVADEAARVFNLCICTNFTGIHTDAVCPLF